MHKVAVLVISNKCYSGEMQDESGKRMVAFLEEKGLGVVHYALMPKELPFITRALMHLCDEGLANLILTLGGTGFAKNDVTPEATREVSEKLCDGIPEAIRYHGMTVSRRAMLSRAKAGIRGETLIVNLPGNPEAVSTCLEFVLPELLHGLAALKTGDASAL